MNPYEQRYSFRTYCSPLDYCNNFVISFELRDSAGETGYRSLFKSEYSGFYCKDSSIFFILCLFTKNPKFSVRDLTFPEKHCDWGRRSRNPHDAKFRSVCTQNPCDCLKMSKMFCIPFRKNKKVRNLVSLPMHQEKDAMKNEEESRVAKIRHVPSEVQSTSASEVEAFQQSEQVNEIEAVEAVATGEESVTASSATELLTEVKEADILTGHFSDPGLYCVKDHSPRSVISSDRSQGDFRFDGGRQIADCHLENFNILSAEHMISPQFLANVPTGKDSADDDDRQYSGLKRVEEWVKSIENVAEPVMEMSMATNTEHQHSHSTRTDFVETTSRDIHLASAAARSLDFHATVAHLNGIGLNMLPSLGTFCHLKVLNLSANSIGKITPGALPRTLHSLDLSRNRISVIEGFRDLARLRILNLSYNRISRIGQGLANCTSIRELHLACNKISEVEGLHRLTKLGFLDLSGNKLSTTKSLGQIAANYTSLTALNLVGNAVQVNIGEEQLRRLVSSLAPNLIYLNKQVVNKGGTGKSVARSVVTSTPTRHSPHNTPGSKAKRITHQAALSSSSNNNNNSSSSSSSNKKKPPHQHHHHHHRHNSATKITTNDDGWKLVNELPTSATSSPQMMFSMQRVRSDGALQDIVA